jgi:hypothetical protein
VVEKRSIYLVANARVSGTMLVDEIHTPKHRMHVPEKKEVEEEGDVRIDSSMKVQRASIKVGDIFVRPNGQRRMGDGFNCPTKLKQQPYPDLMDPVFERQ